MQHKLRSSNRLDSKTHNMWIRHLAVNERAALLAQQAAERDEGNF